MDARTRLQSRLSDEFDDRTLAAVVVERLSDALMAAIEAFVDGDIEHSPSLSFRPPSAPLETVDSIIAFAFGYRLGPSVRSRAGTIPAMADLLPGPVNVAIAAAITETRTNRPLPVVAQWEIAHVLQESGGTDVISVEPVVAADGAVTYLSTSGVAEVGLCLAADAGIKLGRVGVFGHRDHVPRCVATVRAAGLDAVVVDGARLPGDYDAESGQRWTRDRATWVATDLFARTQLAASTDWTPLQ